MAAADRSKARSSGRTDARRLLSSRRAGHPLRRSRGRPDALGPRPVVAPTSITALVNTGDDTILHGLHISPDLDTITYTLAGMDNRETGWGWPVSRGG